MEGKFSDLSKFDELIDRALQAFGSDVSYAVAMSRSASSIERKREVWALRLELRTAEKEARERCCSVVPFRCKAQSPCGVGDCIFATGDFANIGVEDWEGVRYRPQMDSTGRYSIESAMLPLRDYREHKGK